MELIKFAGYKPVRENLEAIVCWQVLEQVDYELRWLVSMRISWHVQGMIYEEVDSYWKTAV